MYSLKCLVNDQSYCMQDGSPESSMYLSGPWQEAELYSGDSTEFLWGRTIYWTLRGQTRCVEAPTTVMTPRTKRAAVWSYTATAFSPVEAGDYGGGTEWQSCDWHSTQDKGINTPVSPTGFWPANLLIGWSQPEYQMMENTSRGSGANRK